MLKHVSIFLILLIINPFSGGAAEPLIHKDDTLDLDQCIAIARKMHPDIIAAANDVKAWQAKIGQAQSAFYPHVDWSTSFYKSSGAVSSSIYSGSSTGTGSTTGGATRTFEYYSSNFSLNQVIYDFGKINTEVKIETLNKESAGLDLENVTEQIVFNVKQAYYSVLKAKRDLVAYKQTVERFQLHLDQAQGFLAVGIKSKFDVTKAEVDLSNAKLSLITAENTLRYAKLALDNAMGIPNAPDYEVEDNLEVQKETITLESAIQTAMENRADLLALNDNVKILETELKYAKKAYYPVLTGNASFRWSGAKFPLDDGWSVGAALSLPVFNGFLTSYQLKEVQSNLESMKASVESLKQHIVLEVQQAYLYLKDASERIPTNELLVKQAQENLDITNGRYTTGVGNPIEVTDAQVAFINAQTQYNQTLYDYKIAQASLNRAMGLEHMMQKQEIGGRALIYHFSK